jgi:hypothetical protein
MHQVAGNRPQQRLQTAQVLDQDQIARDEKLLDDSFCRISPSTGGT